MQRTYTNSSRDFLIREKDIEFYCKNYKPLTILRYQESEFPDLNFGKSKGLGFDRVIIYPTDKIKAYIKNGDLKGMDSVKAKFYVAITRARFSVGIIYDYSDKESFIDGITKYEVRNCPINSNKL